MLTSAIPSPVDSGQVSPASPPETSPKRPLPDEFDPSQNLSKKVLRSGTAFETSANPSSQAVTTSRSGCQTRTRTEDSVVPTAEPRASIPGRSTTTASLEEFQVENKLLRSRLSKLQMELEKRPVTENVEGSLDVKLAKTKQQLALVTEELKDRTKQLDAEREDSQRKLLDPTWSLLYKAMKKEVEEKTKKIELLQREMLGVGFTPSSITGKKIVAKLKAMQTENEELGKQLCQGRVEQLQTALALEKTLVEQLRREVREANEQALDLNQENEDLTAECFSLRAQLEQTRSDPRESS